MNYPERDNARRWTIGSKLLVVGLLGVVAARSGVGCADANGRGSGAPTVAASASAADDDYAGRVNACIDTLAKKQLSEVQRHVESKYGLGTHDAVDVARDALLAVCEAHAAKQYEYLPGAFTLAAQRRAHHWRLDRYTRCAVELNELHCVVAPEGDRVVATDQILEAIQCREDATHQKVIYLHLRGDTFPEIGKKLAIPGDAARDKWNNAIKRARARLIEKCGT